jgi:hypothetical protein
MSIPENGQPDPACTYSIDLIHPSWLRPPTLLRHILATELVNWLDIWKVSLHLSPELPMVKKKKKRHRGEKRANIDTSIKLEPKILPPPRGSKIIRSLHSATIFREHINNYDLPSA